METSTTDADNPTNGDAVADSTTTTDPQASTDTQPANNGDNLDPSKSDDTTVADGDKKPEDNSNADDAPASPKIDEDLDEWIEKRGLTKPETDEQKQSYQELRNSQREYTREQQAKKEAADAKALGAEIQGAKPDTQEEDDDELDPLEKRQAKLEADLAAEKNTRLQSEFYTDNQVNAEEHKTIMEIFKEKIESAPDQEAKVRAYNVWSTPAALPDLLDLARVRLSKAVDTSAIGDEAARKERERIARESQAKSPGRAASSTTTSDKTEDEARTERFKDRFNSK